MGELIKFKSRKVNDVTVDQLKADGFINGTAMCSAYNKNIVDWFRTTRTFNLFCSLASDLGIKSNMVLHHDSDISRLSATKYVEMFPGLIRLKRGSPENGGGVWIHPDVSIDLASDCDPLFGIQVARWVREWFATGNNPVQVETDLDKEAVLWQQRHDIRVYLKDYLRPELMDVVVVYALKNCVSPIKLCSEVHDLINKCIQGISSKDIKALHGLPLGVLIRDFFGTEPLLTYAAINKLAKNSIEDFGINPIQAVNDACDRYLSLAYQPKPVDFVENIHAQGRRIQQAKASKIRTLSNHQQLSLFGNDQAV